VGVAALGALAAGSVWLLKERRPPAAGSEVASRTVLVADFENRTGDAVLDGTMESVFGLALEEASFINSYSRTAARRIAEQVQPGSTGLGEAAARLVAVREGISVVTSGAIERSADGYRISARALDAVTGKPLLEAQVDLSRRDEVLAAANKLAARVRRALGDTTPESAQLAAGETFTAASVEAAHEYALGQEAFALGRWGEAEAHYKKAVELDPNLGRAYAGMAAVHANQGRRQEADRWFREAMARISRMSDREKYRTRGLYFVVSREGAKAAEQFEDLLKRYPADTAATANLALAHFYRRDMAQALAVGRRAVELSPRNVPQKNNLALYAMYAGDFEEAARQFEEVLKLNPSFDVAFVGLGLSQLALGRVDEAAATYGRLAALGERGASRAAMALADLALYEGRVAEAIPQLEKGIALDEKQADPDGAATKLVALAEVERLRGRERQARAAVDRAVSLSRGENVTLPAALVYLGLGAQDRAIALADELGRRLEPDPQAYAGIIWGEARRRRGQAREAVKAFEDARKLADTWMGRVGLARAYLEARAFTEAHAELENAMRRRGEATALFLDEMPTFSVFPPLYVDLARAEIGLNDPAAADSLKTFLAIRATADGDPLVAEARRLLTSAAPVR
jgi:tetratricopeptide (TPR) repeat protein